MRLVSRMPPEPSTETAELAAYAKALAALHAREVPFLVGGAYALKHYCGITRNTKDLDLFLDRADLYAALGALSEQGFRTEVTFPHWLAKAYSGERFIDIIFNSGNGANAVDARWFDHAERDVLLGVPVAICPVEETIWSKSFVMERERYDGADVAHLLLARGARLDWARLLERFGANARVLLAHVILFGFVYPQEATEIPPWVTRELLRRAEEDVRDPSDGPVCRGTLISREQYLVDLARGYRDGRLPPTGAMTEEAIAHWTAAIGSPH